MMRQRPTLEDALIALKQATDGRGLPVSLYSGGITAAGLRVAACEFAKTLIDPDAAWVCGLSADSDAAAVCDAEAAAWDNLALLARATAAALREETR